MRTVLVRVTNVFTLSVRETGIVDGFGVAAPIIKLAWKEQQQGVRKLWNAVANPLYRLRRRGTRYRVPGWTGSQKALTDLQPLSDPTATLEAAQNWAGETLSKEYISEIEWQSSMHVFAHTALCDAVFDIVEEVHELSKADNVTGQSQVAEFLLPHPATHGYTEGGVRSDDGDNRDLYTMVGHWILQIPLFWLILQGAKNVRLVGRFNSDLSNIVRHDWDSDDAAGDRIKANERPIPWTHVTLNDSSTNGVFANLRTGFPNPRVFGGVDGFFDGCSKVTQYCNALVEATFLHSKRPLKGIKQALTLVFTRIASDAHNELHGSRPHRGRPKQGPKVFIETRGEYRLQANSFVGTKLRDTRRAKLSALLPVERRSQFACASWITGWNLEEDVGVDIPPELVRRYKVGSEMWVVPQHVFAQIGMVEEAIREGINAILSLVNQVPSRWNTSRHHFFVSERYRTETDITADWMSVLRNSHPLWEPLRHDTDCWNLYHAAGNVNKFTYGNGASKSEHRIKIPNSKYFPFPKNVAKRYGIKEQVHLSSDLDVHRKADDYSWVRNIFDNLVECLNVQIPVYIHRPLKFYDNHVTEKVTDYTGETTKVNPPMMDYDDDQVNVDLLFPAKSLSLSGHLIDKLSEVL